MILETSTGQVETNCDIASFDFKLKASALAFDIQSSKLYADSKLAIVRELLTNAYDAHKAAGTLDKAIDVYFPDNIDRYFKIRDYGTGLSKEDMLDTYITFFHSTKSEDNEFTGCFGLGSKTPFSYTNTFTVNSYFNGIKYKFLALKKNGYPSITLMGEEPTNEHNGLEIQIPTTEEVSVFAFKARQYLRYIPEILINSNIDIDRDTPIYSDPVYKLKVYPARHLGNTSAPSMGAFLIKQGLNVYPVKEFIHPNTTKHTNTMMNNFVILVEVPIGELSITPSRETLSAEIETSTKVKDIIATVESLLPDIVLSNLDKFVDKMSHTAADLIQSKYLTNSVLDKRYKHLRVYSSETFGITITGLQLSTLHHNNYLSSGLFSDTTYLIIPNTWETSKSDTAKLYKKITNICDNYGIDKVGLAGFGGIGAQHTSTLRQAIFCLRYIEALVNNLNSINEFKVNIQLISLKNFLKKYPNDKPKKVEKSGVQVSQNKYMGVFSRRISTFLYNENNVLPSYNLLLPIRMSHWRIGPIKEKHPKEYTIIVPSTDTVFWTNTFLQLLTILLHKVKDKDGNILLRYLKSKGLDVDRFKRHDYEYLHVMRIAKSNVKLFEGYAVISSKDIIDLYRNKTTVLENSAISKRNKLICLSTYLNSMKYNFRGRAQDYVIQSSIYKRLKTLIKHLVNKGVPDCLNIMEANELEIMKRYGIIAEKDILYTPSTDILPIKLRSLIDNIFSKCDKQKFTVPKGDIPDYVGDYTSIVTRKGTTVRVQDFASIPLFALDKEQKLQLLRILRGE